MKKTSSDKPSYTDRIRSWARTQAHGGSKRPDNEPVLPLSNAPTTTSLGRSETQLEKDALRNDSNGSSIPNGGTGSTEKSSPIANNANNASNPAGAASEPQGTGPLVEAGEVQPKPKKNVAVRFFVTGKKIMLHSWINAFLIFVPIGIAVAQVPNMPPSAIFAVNAVAIIPLAGLLSHATESVARKLGDTIGALLNVTFGNAVELIIL